MMDVVLYEEDACQDADKHTVSSAGPFFSFFGKDSFGSLIYEREHSIKYCNDRKATFKQLRAES